MSVLTALYSLLIGPLELFFEILFAFANRIINNPGLSIIFLSLAMNFLVLPLYKQADAMQEEERVREEKLKFWVDHIKKTFKGDERFMMLQTYYRQNNYKPTDALKGSLSLLLEIPFFIAAYNFLSGLQLLKGVSFGPIKDLGAPDGMLVIAGIAINVLPILMTLINIISGAIYTKGLSLKSKIQLYGMAVIFLVFLYESPAGLVFYWTLNNLFSLVKNIFYKLKNPKKVLSILSSVSGAILMLVVLFIYPMGNMRTQIIVLLLLLLLQLPVILHFFAGKSKSVKEVVLDKKDKFIFFSGCVFITVLTGLLIPSALIKASPEEFVDIITYKNPLWYVLNSFLMAAGTFIVWFGIFYMLAKPAGKRIMGLIMWILSGAAAINYMFFGTDYGNISSKLKFDTTPAPAVYMQIINIAVIAAAALLMYFIWKKKKELVKAVSMAVIIATVGMSLFNIKGINDVVDVTVQQLKEANKNTAEISLSKEGKNVVVIMMDRAISGYIPYMFNEKPELREQFEGFTYYPNTISFGGYTNFGVPAVYGGYEYTPEEMNKRDKESLASKQNEALKVMPVLFDDSGFDVTVFDPTYAGYKWFPDLSIYDEYPDIKKYITMGKFMSDSEEITQWNEHVLNRNFFCYSLFKVSPLAFQPSLYTKGFYNEADAIALIPSTNDTGKGKMLPSLSKAVGINDTFMRAYEVLRNLPNITKVEDKTENTFLMMSNDTSHEPTLLQEPDYTPAVSVDNIDYDREHTGRFTVDGKEMKMGEKNQMAHYHVNMAMAIQLGNWFDHLRDEGVYDNTRIIIVADHGRNLRQFDDLILHDADNTDAMLYNPLLMVKDFGSHEFTTDDTFMTNGDVPVLAMEDLIENPVNPFTGKKVDNSAKYESELHIIQSNDWSIYNNNGNTFNEGGWYSVKDNIFDRNNWKKIK